MDPWLFVMDIAGMFSLEYCSLRTPLNYVIKGMIIGVIARCYRDPAGCTGRVSWCMVSSQSER